ncbi:hypothetical protein [Micrococcus luteus]|nr:hypothetical protein [Micrococcus luteus]
MPGSAGPGTGAEAAEHGMRQITAPDEPALQMIAKIIRRHNALPNPR